MSSMNGGRFLELWGRCEGMEGEAAFGKLEDLYGEEHRAYHGGEHIEDCLREFDRVPGRPVAVEMAIWFHDAIYDPRKKDNEEESARHFAEECRRGGLTGGWIEDVGRLIRVTAHHRPSAADEAVLCDIDLSILGRTPEEYARYVAAVRREYAWVAEADWCIGRAAVLRSFLERPAIYLTEEYAPSEAAARRNLEGELRSTAGAGQT